MPTKSQSFVYRNGLSLVFLLFFIIAIIAQAFTGWKKYNQQLIEENASEIHFTDYLGSGHFISATLENFESEFLQMALYVVLTVSLRQLGSAESKSLDKAEDVDREPKYSPNAPWTVKKGGLFLKIYSHSPSIAFAILFLGSWLMHFYGSWKDQNAENLLKHQPLISLRNFLAEPRFWFETFQNWQSEFLSVLGIVFLSTYLRQKGSPESKPVDAPHMQTGK